MKPPRRLYTVRYQDGSRETKIPHLALKPFSLLPVVCDDLVTDSKAALREREREREQEGGQIDGEN